MEILLSKTFPEIAIFVEKPISTSAVPDVLACSEFLKERKHIVSVGYMLRYLKCVQMMYDAQYMELRRAGKKSWVRRI